MTEPSSPLDRVRAVALLLPGTESRGTTFLVAGAEFARFDDAPAVSVRTGDGEAGWVSVPLSGAVDWTLVEDRIARSWELTAPGELLEAGGR